MDISVPPQKEGSGCNLPTPSHSTWMSSPETWGKSRTCHKAEHKRTVLGLDTL